MNRWCCVGVGILLVVVTRDEAMRDMSTIGKEVEMT